MKLPTIPTHHFFTVGDFSRDFYCSPEQAAGDAGQSAVEYLASVVEFDAWDKLDKDWTSNVALRNMTPDNVSVSWGGGRQLSVGWLRTSRKFLRGICAFHACCGVSVTAPRLCSPYYGHVSSIWGTFTRSFSMAWIMTS